MSSEERRECDCTPGVLVIHEGWIRAAEALQRSVRDGEASVDVLRVDDLIDHGHRKVLRGDRIAGRRLKFGFVGACALTGADLWGGEIRVQGSSCRHA